MSQDARKRERGFLEAKDENATKTDSPKRAKAASFFPHLKPQAQASSDTLEFLKSRLHELEVEHAAETEKIFAATERLAELNEEKKTLTEEMISYLEKGFSTREQPQENGFSRHKGPIHEQFLLSLKKDLAAEGILFTETRAT